MNLMYCPYCNSRLIRCELREFETLTDHVCDPNAEGYPPRPTWICSKHCENSTDCFWDETGDIYVGNYADWHKRTGTKKDHEAINSWSWEYRQKNK